MRIGNLWHFSNVTIVGYLKLITIAAVEIVMSEMKNNSKSKN